MSAKLRVLVIDDEPAVRKTLALILHSAGHEVTQADSGESGIALALRTLPRLIFVDVQLGGLDGLAVTRRLAQEVPGTSIIVMTGYATIENAVEAIKSGACDYLIKPFTAGQVRQAVDKALASSGAQQKLVAVRRSSSRHTHLNFTSNSPAMQAVLLQVVQVAATDATLLLLGPTGTGKSALARHLHELSARNQQPFVTVHCGVIAPSLIESTLFGHRKGAFTGATESQIGLIAAAAGGTLFLDEIGDLAPELQVKLLRLLEEREYVPVGDTVTQRSEARIVAATHCDLKQAVRAGRFRVDLYYRLDVLSLRMPALCERAEDIAALARDLAAELAQRHRGMVMEMTAEFERALLIYQWPGNLRELLNVLERAVILARHPSLTPDLLPEALQLGLAAGVPAPLSEESLEAAERRHLIGVLSRHPTLESAAKALGIDVSTLYRKRERHGLL